MLSHWDEPTKTDLSASVTAVTQGINEKTTIRFTGRQTRGDVEQFESPTGKKFDIHSVKLIDLVKQSWSICFFVEVKRFDLLPTCSLDENAY